jgi:cysteinyl-tRNA synthetase
MEVEALIEARQLARKAGDYAESDRIRQVLVNMGITLADGAHGTEWRKS